MANADTVREPAVLGCWIYEMREPKLLNPAKSLKLGTANYSLLEFTDRNQAVQWVRDDFSISKYIRQCEVVKDGMT
jgi:hypothetical protein